MNITKQMDGQIACESADGADELARLLVNRRAGDAAFTGVVIGELVALQDDTGIPLVLFPGQPSSAAVAARSIVDLHGAHLGANVMLMFDGADPHRPIVMGVLRDRAGWPFGERPGQVDVTSDGERLLLTAKEQLVLRCGKASITLTKAGKVLIRGTYILSRSAGVNRIKGGSVQLN